MPNIIKPETVIPEFENPLDIFASGPLLPFDYCHLTGMKIGLILEVQMELVLRNTNLVEVDRSPLGVDPNAALSRCYLAFGNPHARVSVFNFYENDICRGVPLDYFTRFGVANRLAEIYQSTGWVKDRFLTDAASKWLEKYHVAMKSLCEHLLKLENPVEIAEQFDKYAYWLIPSMFFCQNPSLKKDFTAPKKEIWNFWRKILGDFTVLSVVNRTTFCALASIEEIFFKDSLVGTKQLQARPELFAFKPRLLKTGIGIGVGSLIIWGIVKNSEFFLHIFASIITTISLSIFVVNLIFWLLFTMSPMKLRHRVPSQFKVPMKKIPGYLK